MRLLPGHSEALTDYRKKAPFDAALVAACYYILPFIPLMLVYQRWITEVLCIVVGVMFLIHSWKMKDWGWLKEPPVIIALALWAYLILLVTPLAVRPDESIGRAITWGRCILLFAAIVYWLSAFREELRRSIIWILVLLSVVMLDGYLQYTLGYSVLTGTLKPDSRLTGPLTGVVFGIFLAKMTLPPLGLLVHEAWVKGNKSLLLLYFGLLLAFLGAIVLSNERTALIGYVTGLGFAGLLLFGKMRKARKIILLAGAMTAAALLVLFVTQPQFQSRISDSLKTLDHFSNSPYAQLWKASTLVWERYPITGAGLKNFRTECLELGQAVNYCNLHPHNIYLEWLSEAGIIGFFGFLLFTGSLVLLLSKRAQKAEDADYILIAFAAATLFPTFFPLVATQSFFANWPAFAAWFSIALAMAIVQRGKHV